MGADPHPQPGAPGEGASTAGPPLAQVLTGAAAAWAQVRAGHSLDRALAGLLPPRAGDARWASAVRDVATGTVRRAAIVDFLVAQMAHRPPDPAVAALLGVALAQLLARSYPDFTVVDQTVQAARATPATAAAGGFINAVLRGFLRERDALEARALADPARRYNVPPWWLRRVEAEYGARAAAALQAQSQEPPMVLRVNRRRATLEQAAQGLREHGHAVTAVGPAALWLHRPLPVERIPGFAAGLLSVQDAGAQCAAPWLQVADGMRVLDACAAPGGKTAHLLELADCHLDAVERDAGRAARIGANLQRLGLESPQTRICVADALTPAAYWNGEPYDRILLDAPCSASGVVRRHPDVTLLRRESDVAKLATQQLEMLRALWPLLAPAGRLLYVVCSVFAEEGRRPVSAFLRRQPGARRIRLPGDDATGLQLLPTSAAAAAGQSGAAMPVLHDGFYYALLEKT